jgi:hypothetical protein
VSQASRTFSPRLYGCGHRGRRVALLGFAVLTSYAPICAARATAAHMPCPAQASALLG